MTGEISGDLAPRAAGHASQDGTNRPATIGATVHIPPGGAGCLTASRAAAPLPLRGTPPPPLSGVAPPPPGGTICASGKSKAQCPPGGGADCPTARSAAVYTLPGGAGYPSESNRVARTPPTGTICPSEKSAAAPPPLSGAGHPASLNRVTNPPAGDKAVREKLRLSADEVEDLTERDVRCPYCGFLVTRVFPDAAGHLGVSCRKCKRQMVLNLAYFRRRKRRSPPVLPGSGGLPGGRGRGRGGTGYARR